MKSYILSFLFLTISFSLFSQSGKLMLVGGGSEKSTDWSWSNQPYQWAVENAHNKKVAIISTAESSDPNWLPDYFISLGATESKNFIIDSEASAQNIDIYNELSTYGVLFFKGGDQSEYYKYYKNSQVTNAISFVYQSGGVIAGTSAGMAILSSVIYTAENNSVYPDQILENINHNNITLKNDFLDFLPGYLTDTHFVERGRMARLIGFLGNWSINNGQNLYGIGVDDRTAFCIDQTIGTVYGTGAVSIYSFDSFNHDNQKPVSESINSVKLIHGQEYDLENHTQTTTYQTESSPIQNEENIDFKLFLTGGNSLDDNITMIEEWLNQYSDDLIIITKSNSSLAQQYKTHIENTSNNKVHIIETTIQNDCHNIDLRRIINLSSHFLFIDNQDENLADFLQNDKTGKLLASVLPNSGNSIAMVGEDSKLAGSYYASNTENDPYNSYYGELEFKKGISLLKNSIVMPHPYNTASTDYYENKVSAVPYALVEFRMKYGIYVNNGSYIKVYQDNNSNLIDSKGDYSNILIANNSSLADKTTQVVNSAGNSRNIYGFDKMTYSFISNSPLTIGTPNNTSNSAYETELLAPENLSVTSNQNDNKIELIWDNTENLATEIIIERKKEQNSYTILKTISSTNSSYTDEIEEGNEYTYRLAYKNSETESCYSNEVTTSFLTGLIDSHSNIKVFPNPINQGFLKISGLKSSNKQVSIYGINGSLKIRRQTYEPEPNIDISTLINGIYFLHIINEESVIKKKIIINKSN